MIQNTDDNKRKYIGFSILFFIAALLTCFIAEPVVFGVQWYDEKKHGYFQERDHIISWTVAVVLGQCLQMIIGFMIL